MQAERVTVTWPLSDEQRTHVSRMSELIRRFGAGRFTQAHVVRADERDFPDAWEPTLPALYRLVYRLLWHAHVDAEIEIDDVRGGEQRGMLRTSALDFVEAKDGRAAFQVAALGNDDIAGLASHVVGEAFLALQPSSDDPFRATRGDAANPTEASLAACYLGLGVLVANSSMYRRHQSRVVGREVQSEQRIERAGGLSIGDATLLLAVQLTVRDDVPDAVATLHAPQREWIERWLEVLDPHEDELRTMLGLDGADETLPSRPAQPRVPGPAIVEPAPLRNEGLRTFRVPKVRSRAWLGLGLGFVAAIVGRVAFGPAVAILFPLPIGLVGGLLVRRPGFQCFACKHVMPTEQPTCATCRITFTDTLATKAAVKARLAEWAREAEEDDAGIASEAERAYHPDV